MAALPISPISDFVAGIPRLLRLPVSAQSVPAARRFVEAQSRTWHLTNIDDVVLVADELVENAIRHAREDVAIAIGRRADRIVVQVQDDNDMLPVPYPFESLDERGRGLAVVDALAEQWGATPLEHGKRVWAELPASTC